MKIKRGIWAGVVGWNLDREADFRRRGRKASVTDTEPMTLTSKIFRYASRAFSQVVQIPALLTNTSILPYFSSTSFEAASTEVSSVTSSWMGETVPWMEGRKESVAAAAWPLSGSREPRRIW
jgi:hypothetical protein